MKFGFVILNFLTSDEAIDAVKSVNNLKRNQEDDILVFVVDNGSPNEIYKLLANAFKNMTNVTLIRNQKNDGFAKGNNVGINAARAVGCDFVTCLNNDVVLSKESDFLSEFKKIYQQKNIAIIGPKILDSKNKNQNPFLTSPPTKEQIKYRKKIYTSTFGKIKYWLSRYYIPLLVPPKKEEKTVIGSTKEFASGEYYALHGSVVTFTPAFFNTYSGFDPATFLYGEELILAEMLRKAELTCFYTENITAFHSEDVSTDVFLKNKSKEKFCLKHEYDSIRHLVKTYY
jgi:GT2 family glycosyltransferase